MPLHLEPKAMRLRRYRVSPEFIREMMTEGYRPKDDCQVIQGIPTGAKVVRIGVHHDSTCFEIIVEHESFQELLEGMMIQDGYCVVRRDPTELN